LNSAIDANAPEIIAPCLTVFARHFSHFVDNDFKFSLLPIEIMLQLLNHKDLFAQNEAYIYKTIKKYITKFDSPSQDTIYQLFSLVRFTSLDYQTLESALNDEIVPKSLLSSALMARLATHENPNAKSPVALTSTTKQLQRNNEYGRVFEYEADFDNKGILYFIATNGYSSEWKHPAKNGLVKVSFSSVEKGDMDNICDLDPKECWSADVPSSWVTIDLGEARSVKPDKYTLRHGGNSKQDCLRHWVLKASDDATNWLTLERHQDDKSLNSNFATHSWDINPENCTKPYRYFRILQTGHNSSSHNFLSLNGIEFYGELYLKNTHQRVEARVGASVSEKSEKAPKRTMTVEEPV